MISQTKNGAVRDRRESKKCRNRGRQRRLLFEPLEDRRLLASYMWSDAAGTLSITLGTGEDLTISETGGVRSFAIDIGTFLAGVGSDAAPGEGSGTISFDLSIPNNISTSVSVDNTGAGAGTNNVTLAGGTLTTATLIVNANAGPTSAIDFTGAMTLAGDVSLTANGAGITDSTGSVVVTGTTTLQATGQDITLDAAGNNFTSVTVNDANNVTLADSSGVDLGLLSVAGNLDVTAGGDITDSLFVTVTGTASFTAGGGSNIVLDALDVQGAIDVTTSGGATISNWAPTAVAASSVGGNLDLESLTGDVDVNGKLTVGGAVNLNAGGAIHVNADIDPTTVAMSAIGDILIDADVTAESSISLWGGGGGAGGVTVTVNGSLTTTDDFAFAVMTITTGFASGDISLAGPVSMAVDGSLTATSTAGAVTVDAKITGSGDFSAVNLTAFTNLTINAPIDPPAFVNLSSNDDVIVNAAVEALTGILVNAGNDFVDGDVVVTATGSLATTVALGNLGVVVAANGFVSGDVLLTGDITTADGSVFVSSSAGDITMADGSVIDAGSSTITMFATGDPNVGLGDITLGLLTTTYTDLFPGDSAIFVNAFGAVLDADAGTGMDLNSPTGGLSVSATNGVGTIGPDDPIEFRASTLTVFNQAAGDISMWTDQSVTVLSAFQTTSTGSIHLTASNAVTSPTITVNGMVQTATGPGDVKLVAEGPMASILLNAIVSTDLGDLLLWADHDIIAGVNVFLQAADLGDIEVYANHDNSNNPGLNDDGTIQFSATDPTTQISILAGNDNSVSFWLGDCNGFIDGSISAANEVSKRGRGMLRLNGTQNNYIGDTHIYDGGLLINGALTNTGGGVSLGGIHVWSSASSADPGAGAGLLGGTGLIQDDDGSNGGPNVGERDVFVHEGGTLDSGDIDPNTCEHLPGTLEIWGDVVFDANSTYRLQLDGLAPGDGAGFHDQLVVLGTVSLAGNSVGTGGANLVGEITYPAVIGSRWEVIDNDDIDLIDTRFEGIPELGFSVFSGRLVNVSYVDDLQNVIDNDVVLTLPGRYDFNGFHGYTQRTLPYDMYDGVSPYQEKTAGNSAGWMSLPPQWFERHWPDEPPYSTPLGNLVYDGQATDTMGNQLTFVVDVLPNTTYEVMILTGDTAENHDKELFLVDDVPPPDPIPGPPAPLPVGSQTTSVWGAGALEGGGNIIWGGGTPNTQPTGYYRWIPFTAEVGADGKLYVTMADLGGQDPAAVILGLDIRPAEAVGELTITDRSGLDPEVAPFTELQADGDTIDIYSGTGAPPGAMLTVTVSATATSGPQYATITTDADPKRFGGQVMADPVTGAFTFSVLRPATLAGTTSPEDWTILVEETSGLSRGTEIQPYETPDAKPLRFDFGNYNSPVDTANDFLPVEPRTTYNATRGYGWTTRVASKDRLDTTAGTTVNTPLRRDFNYSRNGVFRVDLAANTTYYVRTYHANPHNGTYSFVQGAFEVYTNTVLPYAAGSSTLQHSVPGITPGTTDIGIFQVATGADGVLFLDFRSLGSFLISGVEISVGALNSGNEVPLQAAGDPLDAGAAAISVEQLQPVLAEASARWSATGLTAAQTATLANVQFAVADLGGPVLGLANPATNQIRIDDDAARFGWSVTDYRSPITDHRSPITGMDLLTVVMHELGHLLGHEHSDDPDDLMASVLSLSPRGTSSPVLSPSPFLPHPSSLISSPSSFIARSSSRADDVFAEWGDDSSNSDSQSPLVAAKDGDLLAAATVRPSEEATQAKVPRRSRLPRYERDLDAWFADLAAEEAGQ